MAHAEYDRMARASHFGCDLIIGADNVDLFEFDARGGKIVGFHGTIDNQIPPGGSLHYCNAVRGLDPFVDDYYRLFLAPGINHCFGGPGAFPDGTFEAMRRWVEEGIAPDTLNAASVDTPTTINSKLCPYPKKQVFNRRRAGNKAPQDIGFGDFDCV